MNCPQSWCGVRTGYCDRSLSYADAARQRKVKVRIASLQLYENCDNCHAAKSPDPPSSLIERQGSPIKRSIADRRGQYGVSSDQIEGLPSGHLTSLQAFQRFDTEILNSRLQLEERAFRLLGALCSKRSSPMFHKTVNLKPHERFRGGNRTVSLTMPTASLAPEMTYCCQTIAIGISRTLRVNSFPFSSSLCRMDLRHTGDSVRFAALSVRAPRLPTCQIVGTQSTPTAGFEAKIWDHVTSIYPAVGHDTGSF